MEENQIKIIKLEAELSALKDVVSYLKNIISEILYKERPSYPYIIEQPVTNPYTISSTYSPTSTVFPDNAGWQLINGQTTFRTNSFSCSSNQITTPKF